MILSIANKYPIKKVFLFGSRAEKTDYEISDVDLIMEFSDPISLLKLSKIKMVKSYVMMQSHYWGKRYLLH